MLERSCSPSNHHARTQLDTEPPSLVNPPMRVARSSGAAAPGTPIWASTS
jgi:hypothetical protein